MTQPTCPLLRQLLTRALAMLLALAGLSAAQGAAPLPLSGYARPLVEQFLVRQTAGLSGKVQISIDTPLSGNLPPCDALEPFLPAGTQLRGRISVGVRCLGNPGWSRYIQARIALMGNYHAAARSIEAGHILTTADTVILEADMASLPASVLVDSSQLLGKVAVNRITSGAPLRREQLRGVLLVQQGQTVTVVSRGPGFVVKTEGKAMTAAQVGMLLQVRMQNGQLVSGTLRADGIVEHGS